MMKTKQICVRLPGYHLGIIEAFQEEKGLTLTDAIKEIILEHHRNNQNDGIIERFILRMEDVLSGLKPYNKKIGNSSYEIADELNAMSGNIGLILKALHVIGTSDVRTSSDIEEILGELR